MKPRRLLSRAAMSLWLLPLVVVVVLWTRSHFRLDELSRVTERNETEAIVSYRGACT